MLGSTLLGQLAMLCAPVGARTRRSSARVARVAFGRGGTRLATLCTGLGLLGWFAAQLGFLGNNVARAFGLFVMGGSPARFAIVGALVITWTAKHQRQTPIRQWCKHRNQGDPRQARAAVVGQAREPVGHQRVDPCEPRQIGPRLHETNLDARPTCRNSSAFVRSRGFCRLERNRPVRTCVFAQNLLKSAGTFTEQSRMSMSIRSSIHGGHGLPLRSGIAISVASMLWLASTSVGAATVSGQVRITKDTGAVDLGAAPASDMRRLTFALKIVDRPGLEAFIASTTDRNSPNFRKFMTPAQFAAAHGQPAAVISRVTAYLQAHGMAVTKVYGNHLLISAKGTNAQLAALFGSPVHKFSFQGQAYQKPVTAVGVPAELQDVVASVAGLSTQAIFKPHSRRIAASGAAAAEATVGKAVVPKPGAAATGVPGSYTVLDLAKQNNITPLYARGLTGAGTTLGILTFANFKQSDAYAYWASLGLNVAPNRITEVLVDGGTDDNGAEETTLDVQQSGGVAPGAKIRVYEAPNTDAGAIDLYAQAVEENLVDTLSVSWGLFEIAYDPDTLAANDAILLQAAAQGIPLTASAGDSGAFDINRSFPYPTCTTTLTVDFPASSPFVLAAGGTTLAGVIPRKYGAVTVPSERPWGWDYLRDYYVRNYGQAYYYGAVFPVGGGGGVSVQYPLPAYQAGLAGVKTSAPAQSLFCSLGGAADLADLPVGYGGRNVPDVSLNADPFTGYSLYFEGEWSSGSGGTSFVAPQLNGIVALLTQQAGGRVGFLNPQLYGLFKRYGYGAGSPFKSLSSGGNLFYTATNPVSYNPAAGIGTLNVDNLAKAFVMP